MDTWKAYKRQGLVRLSPTPRQLPTKQRLAKFYPQEDLHCPLCQRETEDDHHLFYGWQYASAIWIEIQPWWAVSPAFDSIEGRLWPLLKMKRDKQSKQITFAIFLVVIHHTRLARNNAQLKHQIIQAKDTIKIIKEQILHRVVFLHTHTKKYSLHLHKLLQ
ncbi:hypothetical protein Cgig2_015706 [Carnegiea gigantea]|uniref:Reverse transcriptase zinc-binding domain-containing protein n=1 Tax=Carnegiea gigantea TaxID=171969 RepID=A0A9Q1JGB9_9CARY|nr:hypothetical protein Cgig2_015706 [Carnegiea gigantea]